MPYNNSSNFFGHISSGVRFALGGPHEVYLILFRAVTHPIPSHAAHFAGCQRLECICRQGEVRRGDRPRRREPSCEGVGRAGNLERDRWAAPEHVHRGGWASPASEPAQVRLGRMVAPSALPPPLSG